MGNERQGERGVERAAMATIAGELAALSKMTTRELAERYRDVFGVPTRSNHKDYLRKRIAWRIQERAHGGLSQRALERIEQLAPLAPARRCRPRESGHDAPLVGDAPRPALPSSGGARATSPAADVVAAARPVAAPGPIRDPRLPPPGTVLSRTHKNIEHRVTVLAQGVEHQGVTHRSLSSVARAITGTAWNGFAFFGLSDRTGGAGGDLR